MKSNKKPHDEAFKKLLQTFFHEFMELFFPDVSARLDPSHTKLLMQEVLVDVIGEQTRVLDLLVEARLAGSDAYLLVVTETQSYKELAFSERMFIYFSRLFERHRNVHKLIVPIAIFTYEDVGPESAPLQMELPGNPILDFRYLQVKLKSLNWRSFIESDNPLAAALLAQMGYNKNERRQVRMAFLRMFLRLTTRIDEARLALIMSFADLYFEPRPEEDEAIMKQLREDHPEEGKQLMELMPAWKRWGYIEGMEQGIEQGIEQGVEKGKIEIAQQLLAKGFSLNEVCELTGLHLELLEKLPKK